MLIPLPSPLTIGELYKNFTSSQGQIHLPDTVVDSFCVSSEDVKPGALFIACRGVGQDGHNFIDSAYAKGAAAVVVADIEALGKRPGFEIANARMLVSKLSGFAYDHPSQALKVIGITGTNGKTSTNWFIHNALINLGRKSIRIGTLGYELDQNFKSSESLTTPAAQDLHKLLNLAKGQNCEYAVLEISSHALHQHRVDDVRFDAAVFTNITHDHLDYHHTFEQYFKAKRLFFELLKASKKPERIFCVNLDNPYGQKLALEFSDKFEVNASFGYDQQSPVCIKSVEQQANHSKFTFTLSGQPLQFEAPLFGWHNAENLAAALGVLYAMGFGLEQLQQAFSGMLPVPGRLEVLSVEGLNCFVDYAHTPDALERVLSCLKELPHNRIILVFGCGGDRDWRKRSVMGSIAARLSSYCIVTSDNPRTESPMKIIEDILESDLKVGENCEVIEDRALAIKRALDLAQSDDIVLVAGKGHEDYQIVGREKHYFSDQQEIHKYRRN